MVRSVVDLPAPFEPMQRDDLARVDVEARSLHRRDVAVVDVQVLGR